MKYYITKHCKDRYLQRVLNGNNVKENLLSSILDDLKSGKLITSEISNKYPRFVLYLKETYGSDKGYNFIQKDNTIFVLCKRKGTEELYDVVTCYIESGVFESFNNTVLTDKEIYNRLALTKYKKYR